MIYPLPTKAFVDSHTHVLRRNAVVNIDPLDQSPCRLIPLEKGYYYSVGIHPLSYRHVTAESLRLLSALAAEPNVVAIGECGLDPNIPLQDGVAPLSRTQIISGQTELLRIHFELSERLGKPMILHIVKAFPEIITLKKLWKPTQPWIIHGFRGKPQLAAELIRHGFYLSFGRRYNPESLQSTPVGRILRETDDMA